MNKSLYLINTLEPSNENELIPLPIANTDLARNPANFRQDPCFRRDDGHLGIMAKIRASILGTKQIKKS